MSASNREVSLFQTFKEANDRDLRGLGCAEVVVETLSNLYRGIEVNNIGELAVSRSTVFDKDGPWSILRDTVKIDADAQDDFHQEDITKTNLRVSIVGYEGPYRVNYTNVAVAELCSGLLIPIGDFNMEQAIAASQMADTLEVARRTDLKHLNATLTEIMDVVIKGTNEPLPPL